MPESEDTNICCFCLGGDTDIPPFGKLSDAQDFVKPCTTCSIRAHKKCLLDWFYSLPSNKIHIIDTSSLSETNGINQFHRQSHGISNIGEIGVGQPPTETHIHINISAASILDWVSSMSRTGGNNTEIEEVDTRNGTAARDNTNETNSDSRNNGESEDRGNSNNTNDVTLAMLSDKYMALLLATCPQCKSNIVFTMRRSSFLGMNVALRSAFTRVVYYGGAILAFTSAFTGIVSMGYIGLTSCGLKMMECLIPGPILVRMLTKRLPVNGSGSSSGIAGLSQLLLGNSSTNTISNLEQALIKGLIDPLKFSRIPVLPIVLYRMRSSSIMSCLLDNNSKDSINNWIAEFMINGYISSLGNHEFVRAVFSNFRSSLGEIIKDPTNIRKSFNLFRGIDFWKSNNLIAMLMPLRWLYDIFFRLTFNRAHFDITMKVRPRSIANTMSQIEIDRLENAVSELGSNTILYRQILEMVNYRMKAEAKLGINPIYKLPVVRSLYVFLKTKFLVLSRLISVNYFGDYIKNKALVWFYKTIACLKNNYTGTLLYRSLTIRCITTVVWPYLSSKLGRVVYHSLMKNLYADSKSVTPEKLMLISNIVGMVGVVLIKDLFNIYMSYKKAAQLSEMSVLNKETLIKIDPEDEDGFRVDLDDIWDTDSYRQEVGLPGAYPD
ncbi:uncharacterized protein RJT20DRAFT_125075 [Scheffersomyces xylosifermentans]|uniref:uncharacterized protein n=1 Tax=Scheffersomyces xylosifermentans TaxID=1304137 RepID=UPI00315D0DA5